MAEKIANIIGKVPAIAWMAIFAGIVVVVFVVDLIRSLGGDLAKFKKVARKAVTRPVFEVFQATARELPVRARKQYKAARKSGEKPSDVITVDACVYEPYHASAAPGFASAVTAVGILCTLVTYFTMAFAKNVDVDMVLIAPALVALVTLVLRIAASIIAASICRNGVSVYESYVTKLDLCMHGAPAEPAAEQPAQEQPVFEQPTPAEPVYDATFGEPERISFEAVEEEPAPVAPETPPVAPAMTPEQEAEMRARARAEALARARANQAAQAAKAEQAAQARANRAQAAAEAIRARQAAQAAQAAPAADATAQQSGLGSAEEVIARIDEIAAQGGSLTEIKQIASTLQRERAKPENKSPEMQHRLNEALGKLLRLMRSAK